MAQRGRTGTRGRNTVTTVALACLPALAAVLAACGSIPEPEAYRPTTTAVPDPSATTPAAAAAAGASPTTGLLVPAGPEAQAPLGTNFEPLVPSGYIAAVLVATDQGVLAGDAAAAPQPLPAPLATFRAVRVVDDLLGGVVAQAADPQPGQRGDIVWLPAERGQPTLIDGTGALLLDTGYFDGTPWAVVVHPTGEVVRIRLVDVTTAPLLTLDHDEQLLALSVAGPVHAVAVSDAACGQIRFHDPDGALINLPAPAASGCEVPRRPAFGSLALSPDGTRLAYTVITYRDDGIEATTEVVVRDLATGTDVVRRVVGQDGERITSLSYDGARVVFLHQARTGGAPATELVELGGGGRSVALPLPPGAVTSSVSFARRSVTGG